MGPFVTAVVVSHDGERWIPTLLAALAAQRRPPDQVIAVDTASSDDSVRLLRAGLGPHAVVEAERTLGFGAAVQVGVAAAEPAGRRPGDVAPDRDWLWLLHDDCAPAPDALRALLTAAEQDRSIAVVGAKVRAWPDHQELLSVGVSITGTGRRETGLEPGELDQGQHDAVRPVLAADSAGMLVRRSRWQELAGFDANLELFRDDVDFGWRAARAGHRVVVCPRAVVFHAEAAARGLRHIDNAASRPHRADRRSAIYTVLANCRGLALPLVALRLAAGSLLRSMGFLLGKAPRLAVDELAAAGSVLARPDRVFAGRRDRRRTARVPPAAVRPLLPPWWLPYRRGWEAVGERVLALRSSAPPAHARGRSPVETGPVAEEAEPLPAERGALSGLLRRPFALALLAAVAAAAISARDLVGAGMLQGGALLPAPGGAADLWQAYLSSWHPVGLGSDAVAPPYIGLLAVVATVLAGKAWLAMDAVLLLAVPLATTTAYLAARRWIGSDRVRAWLAIAYGLTPVLTGAVAQGRLGTVAAAIVAPLAARSATGLFGSGRRGAGTDPRWRAASGTGLWLAVLTAFVPLSYPIAVASIGCVGLALVRSPRGLAQVLTAVALPLVLLMPWTMTLMAEPARWLAEAGIPDAVGAEVAAPGLELALGRPGGPGGAPAWIGAGILAAALVALTRRSRRAPVSAAWAVGLVALAAATAQSGAVGRLPQLPDGFVAWPGFAVIVVQGAALVAAAIAADGAVAALAGGSFGWRQPVVALVAVAAGVVPLLGLTWWLLDGADGSLRRDDPVALPAYLVAAQLSPTRERTLVVDSADKALVTYQLMRDDGMRTGDDALAPPPRDSAELDRLVARLLSAPTARDVDALADHAVANVVLSAPADPRVARRLDTLPELVRTSAGTDQALGWRLAAPTGRARLLPGQDSDADGVVLPSGASSVAARLPAGPPSRTVALAETPDPRWLATLDGDRLAPTRASTGWGEEFVVRPGGGQLRVHYDSGSRPDWLLGQLAAIVAALIFAAPGIRGGSAGAHA